MLAKPAGKRRIHARQAIVCGRKNCTRCTRWRLLNEFKVDRWADLEKTRPMWICSSCQSCLRRLDRERYHRRSKPDRCPKDRRFRSRTAAQLISLMSKGDRYEYQLGEGRPLLIGSAASEDHDPTPVPTGCPRCFISGGYACLTCPDPDVHKRVREARTQGMIVPA